jgi:hypothetical protein
MDTGPNSFPFDAALRIQDRIGQRPDVVTVDVIYQNTLGASAEASVDITTTAGTDFQPVVEAAQRLVWQSQLSPLSWFRIGVDVDVDRQKSELDGEYGSRPKSPGPMMAGRHGERSLRGPVRPCVSPACRLATRRN